MEMYDGRNPYGSRGGYVVSSKGRGRGRGRRGDRGMDYGYDMARDGRVIRSYPTIHPQGDYGSYDMGDMARGGRGRGRGNYAEMQGRDGHHYPQGQGSTYYPIQAMGTFEGYYGMPEQDYGYDIRDDYARYDMRGRRDYGYGYDYGYGSYGEVLSEKELEHWCKKLKEQLDDREKQMFSKENIMQRAKQMGIQMEGFGEKELEVTTIMVYTDYKKSIGQNLDLAIKLAVDWLNDKDAIKGAEKLAVYYDCIVEGEDD